MREVKLQYHREVQKVRKILSGGAKGTENQVAISDGGQVIISAGIQKGAGSQVAISSGGAKYKLSCNQLHQIAN